MQPSLTMATDARSPKPDDTERFWKAIPTTTFVILASDISNINLRYVPERASILHDPDITAALRELSQALKQAQGAHGLNQR